MDILRIEWNGSKGFMEIYPDKFFPFTVEKAKKLFKLIDQFYVALTRAKKKAFLVTVSNQKSDFAMELKDRYGEELKREQWECPLCGGKLLKKVGPYGEFFGCSNYKVNGCTYKRKIK